MSTSLLQEVVPKVSANMMSFEGGVEREVDRVWSLSRQFAKYKERGEFAAFVGPPKAERFSASWRSTPDSRYTLALPTHPHIF